jgi:hypothetical protein
MSWVFRCHLASTGWVGAVCGWLVLSDSLCMNQSLVLQLRGEGTRCVWKVHFERAFA